MTADHFVQPGIATLRRTANAPKMIWMMLCRLTVMTASSQREVTLRMIRDREH